MRAIQTVDFELAGDGILRLSDGSTMWVKRALTPNRRRLSLIGSQSRRPDYWTAGWPEDWPETQEMFPFGDRPVFAGHRSPSD
jgi:hypothetical protein